MLVLDGLDGDARSVLHEQSIDPQETLTVNLETRGAQRALEWLDPAVTLSWQFYKPLLLCEKKPTLDRRRQTSKLTKPCS